MTPKPPIRSTCVWNVSPLCWKFPYVACGAPSTHYHFRNGNQLCRQHAEEFECLVGGHIREFPIQTEDTQP